MNMIQTSIRFPNGQIVPPSYGVCVDSFTNSFDIILNGSEVVSTDELKDLIETKFEVTKIEHYGNNNFFVQVKSGISVNVSVKDLIETKYECVGFTETASTAVVNKNPS